MYPHTGADFTRAERLPRKYAPSSQFPRLRPAAAIPSQLEHDFRVKAAADALARHFDTKENYVANRIMAMRRQTFRGGFLVQSAKDQEDAKKILANRAAFFSAQDALPAPPAYQAPVEFAYEAEVDDILSNLLSEIASGVVSSNSLTYASNLRSAVLAYGSSLSQSKLSLLLSQLNQALTDLPLLEADPRVKATVDAMISSLEKTKAAIQQFLVLYSRGLSKQAFDQVARNLRNEQASDAVRRLGAYRRATDPGQSGPRRALPFNSPLGPAPDDNDDELPPPPPRTPGSRQMPTTGQFQLSPSANQASSPLVAPARQFTAPRGLNLNYPQTVAAPTLTVQPRGRSNWLTSMLPSWAAPRYDTPVAAQTLSRGAPQSTPRSSVALPPMARTTATAAERFPDYSPLAGVPTRAVQGLTSSQRQALIAPVVRDKLGRLRNGSYLATKAYAESIGVPWQL